MENLFQTAPQGSVVLLEDVDALFVARNAVGSVDFSTMLNCMDGVATRRGLVVFMTTNHLASLDPAFVRPGRVDCIVEFALPGAAQFRQALATLGAQFKSEHEEYMSRNPRTSIAALQKHLFDCIMDERTSIL